MRKTNHAHTLLALATATAACQMTTSEQDPRPTAIPTTIQYLEIVSTDVDTSCAALEKIHGVRFDAPVPEFGNARRAALTGGGYVGVRAPMRADEAPVVRPYSLVDNIEKAVQDAQSAGAEIAMPPMEIPGHGRFAIYILNGIQHGLWQN